MLMTSLYTTQCVCFFFNDTATTEIYTLSLHDALPIFTRHPEADPEAGVGQQSVPHHAGGPLGAENQVHAERAPPGRDRKSTRLNSSHANISYAVFCLEKQNNNPSFRQALLHILRHHVL